jgi:tellurite resistance protein TehA-like permease
MTWLKTNLPILFSPTFWGLTFSAVFAVLALYEVADQALLEIIRNWLFAITGVNIVWKASTKVAGK